MDGQQLTDEIAGERRVGVGLDPSLVEDGVWQAKDFSAAVSRTFGFCIFLSGRSYRFSSKGPSAVFQRAESIPLLAISIFLPPQETTFPPQRSPHT